jgi:hypothetical protein
MGHPKAQKNEELRKFLWKHFGNGFETALDEAKRNSIDSHEWEPNYKVLHEIVSEAFNEMNELFQKLRISGQGEISIQRFLSEFDAIFTTNQDLLVEHRFTALSGEIRKSKTSKLELASLPGLVCKGPEGNQPSDPGTLCYPRPAEEWSISPKEVPYIKLHGSSNWRTNQGGDEMMIMGGGKEEQIQENPLMDWYFGILREKLFSPNSRLLILGYSFSDVHINKIILEAIKEHGLKIYIWNPSELSKLMENLIKDNEPQQGKKFFKESFIEHNKVSLKDILYGQNTYTLDRIKKRFFSY